MEPFDEETLIKMVTELATDRGKRVDMNCKVPARAELSYLIKKATKKVSKTVI